MERKVHPEIHDVYGKTVQPKLVVHKEVLFGLLSILDALNDNSNVKAMFNYLWNFLAYNIYKGCA